MRGASADLVVVVMKWLAERHKDRLVGQEFWNLLAANLGDIEREYVGSEEAGRAVAP